MDRADSISVNSRPYSHEHTCVHLTHMSTVTRKNTQMNIEKFVLKLNHVIGFKTFILVTFLWYEKEQPMLTLFTTNYNINSTIFNF